VLLSRRITSFFNFYLCKKKNRCNSKAQGLVTDQHVETLTARLNDFLSKELAESATYAPSKSRHFQGSWSGLGQPVDMTKGGFGAEYRHCEELVVMCFVMSVNAVAETKQRHQLACPLTRCARSASALSHTRPISYVTMHSSTTRVARRLLTRELRCADALTHQIIALLRVSTSVCSARTWSRA